MTDLFDLPFEEEDAVETRTGQEAVPAITCGVPVVLSKRERYIAIGIAAAVGILLLDQLALEPYVTKHAAIAKERDALFEIV